MDVGDRAIATPLTHECVMSHMKMSQVTHKMRHITNWCTCVYVCACVYVCVLVRVCVHTDTYRQTSKYTFNFMSKCIYSKDKVIV